MQNIILQISSALKVTTIDVYFLAIILVAFIIFCILGIKKIYEVLFGLVLGIAIFIVFQYLLLNPNLTVPTFIDHTISKFIVGTSIYLIVILSILVPLNGSLHIHEPRNAGVKILQTLLLSSLLLVFYFSVVTGFIEKSYIYNIDNAFSFITKMGFWNEFSTTSVLYGRLKDNVPTVTLVGVLFVIYRVTFNDVVNLVVKSIFDTLKKIAKSAGKGGGGGGGKPAGGGGGGGGGHDSHGHH